jgi:hypothetical protein
VCFDRGPVWSRPNKPLNRSRRRNIVVSSRGRERAAGSQVNGKAFDALRGNFLVAMRYHRRYP